MEFIKKPLSEITRTELRNLRQNCLQNGMLRLYLDYYEEESELAAMDDSSHNFSGPNYYDAEIIQCFENHKFIGWALAGNDFTFNNPDKQTGTLHIYIRPEYRKQKYGQVLFKAAIDHMISESKYNFTSYNLYPHDEVSNNFYQSNIIQSFVDSKNIVLNITML